MRSFSILMLATILPGMAWADSTGFSGWEAMRVIEVDGRPSILRTADLDGDGRDELIVVNSRYSRLDIYAFHRDDPKTDETETEEDEELGPNVLPLARNVKHTEIQLEQLPADVMPVPVTTQEGTENLALAILVSTPNRMLFYQLDSAGDWQQKRRVDLVEGTISSHNQMILVADQVDTAQLLIPFDNGIQRLPLGESAKASWIEPRDTHSFIDWWLADLDGDGHLDLIEQRVASDQSLVWLRGGAGGQFEPARTLYDRAVRDARVLKGHPKAPVIALDSTAQSMVRRFDYMQSDARPMGKLRPLPLEGSRDLAWCGMQLGDENVLVAADPAHPRLATFSLADEGWQASNLFPAVGNVKAMAAPLADANTLILWVKDSPDLYRSEWDGARLTYPKTWRPEDDSEANGEIVSLATTGKTTWWAKYAGADVVLYRWEPHDAQPVATLFPGLGSTVEEVLWIGGDRLLVKDRRARGLKLATATDGKKAIVAQPTHLQRAEINEYRLLPVGEELHLARFADGVLQWLDDDLQPIDQLMLADGRALVDFVAESLTDGWALEKGAAYVHRLQADSAGVAQSGERIKVIEAAGLVRDHYLGLMLIGYDRLVHVADGRSDVLQQVEVLDERSNRSAGIRKSRCHRFLVADIDLDGREDLLLCDDAEHRLNAMKLTEGKLESLAAWPVFEDRSYPYGDYDEDLMETEPRSACALNFDGDPNPDLALLCHDRLLIYLGSEP
ncbi:MAG: hypothetical protein KDB22_24870 [Planctomycetales bacterium]|nr:hypothetical protein [Planctomycetales bacterium]